MQETETAIIITGALIILTSIWFVVSMIKPEWIEKALKSASVWLDR